MVRQADTVDLALNGHADLRHAFVNGGGDGFLGRGGVQAFLHLAWQGLVQRVQGWINAVLPLDNGLFNLRKDDVGHGVGQRVKHPGHVSRNGFAQGAAFQEGANLGVKREDFLVDTAEKAKPLAMENSGSSHRIICALGKRLTHCS